MALRGGSLQGGAAMGEAEVLGGLAGSLWGVANCPRKTESLHAILGDYCHEVSNRLNSLKLGLYMARRNGPAELMSLESRYMEVERLMEQLQAFCRPIRLLPIHAALGILVDERRSAWESAWGTRGGQLKIEPPPGPPVSASFDPIRIGQGLDAVVAWRGQSAALGSTATIRWRANGPNVVWEWDEPPSGPSQAPTPQALAVPMLAKVVAAHGGRLALDVESGFRLRLHLPATLTGPPGTA